MINVRCPACKRVHEAPESILGKPVQCNDCAFQFVVEATLTSEVTKAPGPRQDPPPGMKAKPPPWRATEVPSEPARWTDQADSTARAFPLEKQKVSPIGMVVIVLVLAAVVGAIMLATGRGGLGSNPDPSQESQKAVLGLIENLKSESPATRIQTLDALGRMGPAAKEALPAITRVLLNENAGDPVRAAAARALGLMGPAARECVRDLNRLRTERYLPSGLPHAGLRPAIYEALEKIESPKEALAAIADDLNREDSARAEALAELMKRASANPEGVRVLGDVVNDYARDWSHDHYAQQRINAARFLGSLGARAREAIPALSKAAAALENMGSRRWKSDNELLAAIKEALQKIDPNAASTTTP